MLRLYLANFSYAARASCMVFKTSVFCASFLYSEFALALSATRSIQAMKYAASSGDLGLAPATVT